MENNDSLHLASQSLKTAVDSHTVAEAAAAERRVSDALHSAVSSFNYLGDTVPATTTHFRRVQQAVTLSESLTVADYENLLTAVVTSMKQHLSSATDYCGLQVRLAAPLVASHDNWRLFVSFCS